ncbi:CVNH domain-containing protein [Candidatus Bathyarchaeota archaeon]|nr:CVNH domain-containing protein [Candidatus Bathyarchaeota archaeon]
MSSYDTYDGSSLGVSRKRVLLTARPMTKWYVAVTSDHAWMYATCKSRSGARVTSRLDLNHCVGNNNGQMVADDGYVFSPPSLTLTHSIFPVGHIPYQLEAPHTNSRRLPKAADSGAPARTASQTKTPLCSPATSSCHRVSRSQA